MTDWLAALERSSVQGVEAFTARELRGHLNISEKRCMDLIRRGIGAGKLRPCRKTIKDLAGRPQTVPAYERVSE